MYVRWRTKCLAFFSSIELTKKKYLRYYVFQQYFLCWLCKIYPTQQRVPLCSPTYFRLPQFSAVKFSFCATFSQQVQFCHVALALMRCSFLNLLFSGGEGIKGQGGLSRWQSAILFSSLFGIFAHFHAHFHCKLPWLLQVASAFKGSCKKLLTS